jgi:CHAT domain-containing protein
MEIWKKVFGKGHPLYATSLSILADYYGDLGNYTDAINLETRALEIRKKALGEAHPDYTISLKQLANLNLTTSNYAAATDYYRQCYRCLNSFILKTFASMTSKERNDFWKTNSDFFTKDLPYAVYKMASVESTKNDINALAYDAQVFSKGLLLNAELEIQKLIEQSGDTTFANRYYKIKQDRATLDELYQTTPEDREMDADSLAKVIDREEHLLVESSKALGDYTKNLAISWRDVQKKLKDNDLAIEFATVKDTVAKQLVYVAFVLKQGMSAPEFVKLFNLDDFYDIKTKEFYTTPKLYNLVWQPLAEYLKGAKTVYFSPAGQLHTIGIEYLSDGDGKIFAEQYDTYRLSSTRELAMTHTINPNRKASTYGGIKYELSPDEWRGLKGVNDSIERSFRDIPQIADNLRGGASGMGYLDGTKIESENIANLLRSANYDVSAMSEAAATEESFKMLSGSGIKILHIGTHGFYENEGDMQNAGYKFYTASSQQSNEDRSLSCSGLLFAGANSALDPKRVNEIPEGCDDGILTAKEISRLDFSGLDLVVLSACQTGLGEITGEGVFGLQRGFKKAGAQTLVMSLWKVFDDSTQMLMTEFFKNITGGMTKRAAFIAAQGKVRAQFPDPKHWAAFVMVDALN